MDAARRLVEGGEAENLSAFVEAAMASKLLRAREAALDAAYGEASRDPAFIGDMESVATSFTPTETDGL